MILFISLASMNPRLRAAEFSPVDGSGHYSRLSKVFSTKGSPVICAVWHWVQK